MDTIQIANILLTRRCNLRCDYCSIVRDYAKMPFEYPKITPDFLIGDSILSCAMGYH